LVERGAKVALCAVTARARGLGEAELDPMAELSSQYELSQIVKEADRFLVFGEA
jgi:sulfur relay (sulfurtransferase) complex TusBCD TusD component (DsrE family)